MKKKEISRKLILLYVGAALALIVLILAVKLLYDGATDQIFDNWDFSF